MTISQRFANMFPEEAWNGGYTTAQMEAMINNKLAEAGDPRGIGSATTNPVYTQTDPGMTVGETKAMWNRGELAGNDGKLRFDAKPDANMGMSSQSPTASVDSTGKIVLNQTDGLATNLAGTTNTGGVDMSNIAADSWWNENGKLYTTDSGKLMMSDVGKDINVGAMNEAQFNAFANSNPEAAQQALDAGLAFDSKGAGNIGAKTNTGGFGWGEGLQAAQIAASLYGIAESSKAAKESLDLQKEWLADQKLAYADARRDIADANARRDKNSRAATGGFSGSSLATRIG
jgi:hypothetical protein